MNNKQASVGAFALSFIIGVLLAIMVFAIWDLV